MLIHIRCPACAQSAPVVDLGEDCGCCGAFHRLAFAGDCRDDTERFDADVFERFRPTDVVGPYACIECHLLF